ncbi:hypothetical protein NQ314_013746 [Rhamnusium bicolor]|uniref:ATPase AAA-type core domain-containing protein n=1 Tax=Rhamnusium bicolor TaxID=1586634 RepID=A0AAV8X504_9CUCU|nr:hypothetical protein NQ314_013746 [Rhamnusium bicolor]
MADTAFTKNEVIGLVIRLTLVSAVTFLSIKWIMNQVDPTNKNKKKARKRAEEQLKRLASTGTDSLVVDKLNDYEMMIAAHLIHPQDIRITWEDIAGLESLIQELKETVILPIKKKELFADSQLTTAPKGCGKTLIAKATAREAETRFINLDLSILTDKWYGESQKLAAAVFTLAVKIQPCIIFIDEIDSFLRARNSSDHEATAMMKAQFMLILENEPISDDVDVQAIAKSTDGFSGSDLRELCRNASIYRVRDYVRNHIDNPRAKTSLNDSEDEYHDALRPITMEDLKFSFNKMRESKIQCGSLPLQTRIDLD